MLEQITPMHRPSVRPIRTSHRSLRRASVFFKTVNLLNSYTLA